MKINFYYILATIVLLLSHEAFAQTQKGLDIDGEAFMDRSGWSVSMPDPNTVAIGAMYNSWTQFTGYEAGHVRVYAWNGSTWLQKGGDINGLAPDDWSGCSVSMPDSNTLAIGAMNNDGNGPDAGQVRVYVWNGSSWVQKGLSIIGESAGDRSGWSVSMPDANTVAIGAMNNDWSLTTGANAGQVRVYSWNGSTWVQKGGDINGEAPGDLSGCSVSMPNANTVAIGAYENNSNHGQVRVYVWNGNIWIQKGVDIDGEAAGDNSGWSISMPDANTVAIGAYQNIGAGSGGGHVRV